MKKKILVAGGTGYIGSHTTVELQNAGYEVLIIDDLSNSNIEVLDGIERITGVRPAFVQLDLKDQEGARKVLEAHPGIDGIILFAASKAVGESVQKPLKYYRNNIVTLINLLELMPEFGIKGIVFSSSCTVYGQPDFNPIGAHPSAEIGELPNGVPQNLIPYLTQTAIGIRKELSVFGDDYNTPDGSCIRDYINIVDLAKAHVVAMDRMLENRSDEPIEIFNLGTGKGVSVLELIDTFERATGVKVPHKIVGRREGDIEQVWANPERANKVLGWTARETLADTLLSAWNWQKRLRERGIQ